MIEYPNPLKDDYRVGRIVGTRGDTGSFSVLDRRSHLDSSLDNGKRLNSDSSNVTRGEGSVISTPSGATTVDGTQSFSLDTGTRVDSGDTGFSDTTRGDGSMVPTSSDVGKCGDAIDVTKSWLVNAGARGGTMVSGGDVGRGAIDGQKSTCQDVRKLTGGANSSLGLVRTVMVAYRKRDAREDPQEYKKKKLVVEEMAVQRLILLVPMDEQDQDE